MNLTDRDLNNRYTINVWQWNSKHADYTTHVKKVVCDYETIRAEYEYLKPFNTNVLLNHPKQYRGEYCYEFWGEDEQYKPTIFTMEGDLL